MNFELKTLDLAGAIAHRCDALIVVVMNPFRPDKSPLSEIVTQSMKSGDFEAKPGKLLQAYRPTGFGCTRLVLVNAGEGAPRHIRQAVAAATSAVKSASVKKLVVCFTGAVGMEALRASVSAVADGSYVYTTTKSKPDGRALANVTFALPDATDFKSAFDHAVATVKGVELAKEWGNRPANHATPTLLAQAAKSLAKHAKVKCEVLGPSQVSKLGMGSFMAVAQGSAEPLRFIVLRYEGAARGQAPVVLVGKGITFDSGGISIKPAPEMDEMKFDMCGAASVLGVFRALAELRPAVNVVGLIPSCENMPDGRAVKPGVAVTSIIRQNLELGNTAAEDWEWEGYEGEA